MLLVTSFHHNKISPQDLILEQGQITVFGLLRRGKSENSVACILNYNIIIITQTPTSTKAT